MVARRFFKAGSVLAKRFGLGTSRHALSSDIAGKDVALVGNAVSLIDARLGRDIEAADLVVRINGAPGMKPMSHGRSTHWLAISKPVAKQRIAELGNPRILWMTTKRHKLIGHLLVQWHRVYFYPRSQWRELFLRLGRRRPSTGMMVFDLIAGLGEFKSLTLYGFDFFLSGSLSGPASDAGMPHDFKREGELIAAMAALDHRIKIVKPKQPA